MYFNNYKLAALFMQSSYVLGMAILTMATAPKLLGNKIICFILAHIVFITLFIYRSFKWSR